MIKGLLQRPVRALLARSGYRLHPIRSKYPVLDINEVAPRELLYHAQVQPFLLQLSFERARANLYPIAQHVFAVAARRAIEGDPPAVERIAATLADYQALADYRNAAEKVGLSADEAPELAGGPEWLRIRPWTPASMEEESAKLRRVVLEEGRAHGYHFRSPAEGFMGTGGDAIVRLHAARLEHLIDSIRSHGFLEAPDRKGAVTAELLIDDDDRWCWQVGSGNHRVSVAFALGISSIPVRVVRVVYRRDADAWPNVRSGLFPVSSALKVFDNAVDGVAPAKAQAWVRACSG